jgi:hypothetical protein
MIMNLCAFGYCRLKDQVNQSVIQSIVLFFVPWNDNEVFQIAAAQTSEFPNFCRKVERCTIHEAMKIDHTMHGCVRPLTIQSRIINSSFRQMRAVSTHWISEHAFVIPFIRPTAGTSNNSVPGVSIRVTERPSSTNSAPTSTSCCCTSIASETFRRFVPLARLMNYIYI